MTRENFIVNQRNKMLGSKVNETNYLKMSSKLENVSRKIIIDSYLLTYGSPHIDVGQVEFCRTPL